MDEQVYLYSTIHRTLVCLTVALSVVFVVVLVDMCVFRRDRFSSRILYVRQQTETAWLRLYVDSISAAGVDPVDGNIVSFIS